MLNAAVFLSLPFVLTMLICFAALVNLKLRSWKEAAAVFMGAAALFSACWDLAFLGLTMQYWGGELLGSEIMWLPIAWDPQTGVVGIVFPHTFGAWFIFMRLFIGFTVLLVYEMKAIRRRTSRRERLAESARQI